MYTVVKCGASGHNIRSNPNLMAPPIGMLALSDQVSVIRTKEVNKILCAMYYSMIEICHCNTYYSIWYR